MQPARNRYHPLDVPQLPQSQTKTAERPLVPRGQLSRATLCGAGRAAQEPAEPARRHQLHRQQWQQRCHCWMRAGAKQAHKQCPMLHCRELRRKIPRRKQCNLKQQRTCSNGMVMSKANKLTTPAKTQSKHSNATMQRQTDRSKLKPYLCSETRKTKCRCRSKKNLVHKEGHRMCQREPCTSRCLPDCRKRSRD